MRPRHLSHIGAGSQHPAFGPAQIVDQHVVILHLPFGITGDAIEHLHDRTHAYPDPDLLQQLSLDSLLERLAEFDGTARQAPLTGQRRLPSAHQRHAPVLDDDGADSDKRAIGIRAVHGSRFNGSGFWFSSRFLVHGSTFVFPPNGFGEIRDPGSPAGRQSKRAWHMAHCT